MKKKILYVNYARTEETLKHFMIECISLKTIRNKMKNVRNEYDMKKKDFCASKKTKKKLKQEKELCWKCGMNEKDD